MLRLAYILVEQEQKPNAVQLHFRRAHLDPRETEDSKEVVDQWWFINN